MVCYACTIMQFLFSVVLLILIIWLTKRIGRLERILQVAPPPQSVPEPAPVPAPTPVPVPMTVIPQIPTTPDRDLEFKVGSKVFTAVGIIAVILGVGFFLRYAFAQNLITESMRVALGIFGGMVLLGIGWFLRQKYTAYAHVLSGGGLALLYLSLYAAFNFYHLVSHGVAFGGMILVAILGVGLSLTYDSLPLLAFTQIGGFLTPFLLWAGLGYPNTFFPYLIILNLGLFAVTLKKPWPYMVLGNLLGTVVVSASWFLQFYTAAQFPILFGYSTVLFLVFLAITVGMRFAHRISSRQIDITIALAAPLIYFLVNFFQLDALHPEYKTLFTVALGVLYVMAGLFVRSIRDDAFSQTFSSVMYGIALVFFVVAIPVQFHNHWITIGWAVEALVMILLSGTFKLKFLRLAGTALFLGVFIRLIGLDLQLPHHQAWFNDRMLSFGLSTMMLVLASASLWFQNERDEEFSILSVLAYGVPLVGISAEIFSFYQLCWLAVVWSLAALSAGILSLRISNIFLRVAGYGTFVAAAIRLVAYDGSVNLSSYHPIFNDRVGETLLLVVCLGVFAYLFHRWRERTLPEEQVVASILLSILINLLLLWIVSVEVLDYFHAKPSLQRSILSVAWALYAIALLLVGIVGKSSLARLFSIILFAVVVCKVFLYDTLSLSDLYRFISFITLGIVLLLSGFLYYRYKDRIRHFIQAQP